MTKPAVEIRASMTTEELERTMRVLEPVYDLVRVVDPSHMQGSSLGQDGKLDMPHRCFDLLNKGRRCQNCISARTVACGHSVSKFEFVGDDAFYISTRYVEVGGKPRAIELVKKINEETLVAPSDDKAAKAMRSIMKHDADYRYRDERTGVLTRSYLDEGINELKGGKLAMLRVTGLEGTPSDDLVSTIAQAINEHVRRSDTLVHLEDATFVIIFEGISQREFSSLLEELRVSVRDALVRDGHNPEAEVVIGAVSHEDSVRELILLARDALVRAERSAGRIVLITKADEANDAHDQLGDVPTPGAHAQDVDALTRMPVVRVFRNRLSEQLESLTPEEKPIYVAHLDIENFKSFNRTYGLSEGDVLLAHLADALRDEFVDDLMTRASVDTFVVATRADDVETRIERVRALLSSLRRDAPLDLKAGIRVMRNGSISPHLAMDQAKIACDMIKGDYSRSLRWFDGDLERKISMRDYLVKSLDTAIAEGYIRPYYQIIVRSFTNKACSAEVLSRWVDPTHGLISPADVIPTLERHHLIHKHDIHIVRCACRDLRTCMDQGKKVVPISVNLSRLDFELCDIFSEIEAVVTDYSIPRSFVGIEVTESTLERSNKVFKPQVDRFREAGYEIWMDDFGSGYSSLNTLKDYQFDVLKIDMAFLRGLEENQNSQKIIRSIVDMAKRIGIRTLAEGVETPAQFRFLRSIGCEMIQGYLFSRPLPIDEVELNKYVGVEDDEERGFLEEVGRINLLAQEPAKSIGLMKAEASEPAGTPFAIVSWNGSELHYFATNESYLQLLRQCGIASSQEAEQQLNDDATLLEAFAAFGGSHDSMVLDFPMGIARCQARVRYVAQGNNTTAYLVSP